MAKWLLDLDAIWGGEWGSRGMRILDGGGDCQRGSGSLGVNVGHPIVTIGWQCRSNYFGISCFCLYFSEALIESTMDCVSCENSDISSRYFQLCTVVVSRGSSVHSPACLL